MRAPLEPSETFEDIVYKESVHHWLDERVFADDERPTNAELNAETEHWVPFTRQRRVIDRT